MKTRHVTSAGGVLVRRGGAGWEVALTLRDQGKVWCLPKGLVEPGESHEQTAAREIREETGYEAELLGPVDTIEYWFFWKPEETRYHKTVHFFLARATAGSAEDHDQEVEAVQWFSPDEAGQRLSHKNEVSVLLGAVELLAGWSPERG